MFFNEITRESIEAAHKQIWSRFINHNEGALYDFADLNGDAILPTAEECRLAKPNAMGWNTPTEDGPFYTAFYIDALCNRSIAMTNAESKAEAVNEARLLAKGLLSFAVEEGKRGFLTRGFSDDGTAFYTASSDDQVFPWFYGLWRYMKSGIPAEAEKQNILRIMKNTASALKENGWKIPCYEVGYGNRGSFTRSRIEDITRLLFILKAMGDLTGDAEWQTDYKAHLAADDYAYYLTNLEVCAKGSDYDRYDGKMVFFPFKPIHFQSEIYDYDKVRIEPSLPFFTTGMVQVALRALIEMEQDETIAAYFKKGLSQSAAAAATHITRHRGFDNDNKLHFECNWRFLNDYWTEQKNIKDTHHLANRQLLEWYKKSPRSPYENNYIREPLFAAWITTLSGDKALIHEYRTEFESILTRTKWEKLFTSTFFVAECVYWQLMRDEI